VSSESSSRAVVSRLSSREIVSSKVNSLQIKPVTSLTPRWKGLGLVRLKRARRALLWTGSWEIPP
jgi:hypothetical protein